MHLIKSKKFELPKVYFIEDKSEIKKIKLGIPFILADKKMEKTVIRMLEYEVLYERAVATGYPFDFKKILKENGYQDVQDFGYQDTVYVDFYNTTNYEGVLEEEIKLPDLKNSKKQFKSFVKDSSCYVNIQKLKQLNVFPVWFVDNIEKAVTVNINNFALYDYNLYNKKLDGMYGAITFTSPHKNLIIGDISSSIPRAVSVAVLTLLKNLAESFYADVLITGTYSTLYEYSELRKLSVKELYDKNGMDNDQTGFKNLLSKPRNYNSVIAFGDNHSPCDNWNGKGTISREDGKKLCQWKVNKLISFHTTSNERIAGYLDWFDVEESNIERVKDWVVYLNK